MVKALGFLDLIAAIILLAQSSGSDVPLGMIIFIPTLLFLKAFICLDDIGSFIDIAVVILIILGALLPIPSFVSIVGAAFLGLKAVMSFFAK